MVVFVHFKGVYVYHSFYLPGLCALRVHSVSILIFLCNLKGWNTTFFLLLLMKTEITP